MRAFHGVLTGVVVLASIGFLPAPAAQAAAPSAPYTALAIDGSPTGWWRTGAAVYDSTNGSTFTASATGTDQVDFRVDKGADNWVFRIVPPIGSTWTSGTDYDISSVPSATEAYVDVLHAGDSCAEPPGKLRVHEVVRGEDGVLTGFAATVAISCNFDDDVQGELRWNSDIPYAAAATDVLSLDFGDRLVGSEPVTRTFTVTSLGTASAVFGDVTFPWNSGAFTVTGNTCSGTSRAYGENCTVTITASPTGLTDVALLRLADNTTLGAREVRLYLSGIDPRTATLSPSSLHFDNETGPEAGAPQRVTVTGTGDTPITFSAARITGTQASDFVVTIDTCNGVSLAKGQSCYVEVAAKPIRLEWKYATLELSDNSFTSPKRVHLSSSGSAEGLHGTYTPVRQQRILDTRIGLGAPQALVPAGGVVRLKVAGQGGIPTSGVLAVVLNVTVTNTTGNGYLTVYPTGVPRPTASSLNYLGNGVRSNSVTIQLGSSGEVDIYTNSGTHIVADVSGWYASSEADSADALGGQIHWHHERIFDSRHRGYPLSGGETARIEQRFTDTRIRAFIVNITAVNPASRGYLTAWGGTDDEEAPATSTVNYLANTVTSNFAIVPVGPCDIQCTRPRGFPSINVYSSVETHLVIDLIGYIDDGTLATGGLRFEPRTPQRIVDSRQGQGLPGKLGGGTTRTVTAPASLLAPDVRALALNVAGVSPTANTYLSVWPTGQTRATSTLNLAAGQTAANATVALLGGNTLNQFNVYNNSGSVDVVVDVVGFFWLNPGTASSAGATGLRTGDDGQGLGPAALGPPEPWTSTP